MTTWLGKHRRYDDEWFKNKDGSENRERESGAPMVNSRTPGQQIDPLQRAQGIIFETDIQGRIFVSGGRRGRGVRSVDVGIEDRGGTFGTIGRGGDEMGVIGHVEMWVVPGGF